eukprot:m.5710 g.5710  ORF g.5710 m.5710 type:complete len:528 (+) comp3369_c0_seq1:288-1871(+)
MGRSPSRKRRRSRSRSPPRHRDSRGRRHRDDSPRHERRRRSRSRSPRRESRHHRKSPESRSSHHEKSKEDLTQDEDNDFEDDIMLPDEEDEEAKIEAARKKRLELQAKFQNMKKEEEKKQPERKPESDNVHTIELKPQKKITSEDIKKDGKKDEDEEDEDMFNDTFVVKKNDGAAARGDIIEDAADKDGYYVIRSGELLDGRYKVMSSQGKGVYSNVVRAKDAKQSDLVVAIKIVRNIELMYKAGQKELDILLELNQADPHRKHYLVKLLRHFVHKGHLCMVFENCSMNLREVTTLFGRDGADVVGLAMEAVQAYAHQLLLSLKLLQQCKVIHADFKPDNILVNETKSQVKLCDLGSALYINEVVPTPLLVSRFYRAPEIILGLKYDYGIDMWALACTLFELYTGKILFNEDTNGTMLKAFMDLKGKFPHKFIRKGQFRNEYFDDEYNFMVTEFDKVTRKQRMRIIDNIEAHPQLLTAKLKMPKRGDSERKKVSQFRDLLDKMLTIDPEKRITPKDALKHPFITEKM